MAQNDIAAQLAQILGIFSKEVTEQLKKDSANIAKETAKEIQAGSPVRTGKYKRGWSSKKTYEGPNGIRFVVYNKTKPALTHLLEKPHASKNGGRVRAIPHIRKPEQEAIKKLEECIEKAVKR